MMERNPTIVKIDNGTMIPPIEAMDRLPPLPERLSKQLEMALQRACESSPIDVTAVRLACLRAVAKLLGRLFAVDPTQAREQELSEKRYDFDHFCSYLVTGFSSSYVLIFIFEFIQVRRITRRSVFNRYCASAESLPSQLQTVRSIRS
jgi:hypothetical protein